MEKYIKLGYLGSGSHGTVYLVKNLNNNQLFALKLIVIDKAGIDIEIVKNEIEILKTISHDNIIKYVESFLHKKRKYCIVVEYAECGDLSLIVKKHKSEKNYIHEEIIWNIFFQIANTMKYLHSNKILHRDLKTQNIFLKKNNIIKLGDFGISKSLENTSDFTNTTLGTPYFLSPEICRGHNYNSKSDIWMIGCMMYELTSLNKPFDGKNLPDLITNIITKKHIPISDNYSKELRDLIDRLLEKDPNQRFSMKDILDIDYIILQQKPYIKRKHKLSNENKTKSSLKFKKNSLFINTSDYEEGKLVNDKQLLNNRNQSNILRKKLYEPKRDIQNLNKNLDTSNKKIINNFNNREDMSKPISNNEDYFISSDNIDNDILSLNGKVSKKRRKKLNNLDKTKKTNELNCITNIPNHTKSKFSSCKNLQINKNYSGFIAQKGQISISISSVESPIHKPVYCVDNIQFKKKSSFCIKPKNFSLDSNKENFSILNELDKDFDLEYYILNNNSNSGLMFDLLRKKAGNELYEKIINLIELEEKPSEFIYSNMLKDMCGKSYNEIAYILINIFTSINTPESKTSTGSK